MIRPYYDVGRCEKRNVNILNGRRLYYSLIVSPTLYVTRRLRVNMNQCTSSDLASATEF